jgi:hypothetical protein
MPNIEIDFSTYLPTQFQIVGQYMVGIFQSHGWIEGVDMVKDDCGNLHITIKRLEGK